MLFCGGITQPLPQLLTFTMIERVRKLNQKLHAGFSVPIIALHLIGAAYGRVQFGGVEKPNRAVGALWIA